MLTETWNGWAIASTRKDGTEKILMFDAFLSLHPDQAEVILRKMRCEHPDKSYRIVNIVVEVRELPGAPAEAQAEQLLRAAERQLMEEEENAKRKPD